MLRLLTKEFGLEEKKKGRGRRLLNCPLVMNAAIDALRGGEGEGARKVKKEVSRIAKNGPRNCFA